MQLKLWALPIILILSSCGSHAPLVDDCGIAIDRVECTKARHAPKENPSYWLTPLQAEAKPMICCSPGDFLVEKIYLITLENHLAKCDKSEVVQPKISDCGIYGEEVATNSLVICSDGVSTNTFSWAQAKGFLCLSSADLEKERVYRNGLIQDIGSCTP